MTDNLFTSSQSEPALFRHRDKPNDWFERCTKKLQTIAALDENWDSYGAAPPSSLSIHYAHAFLNLLRLVVNASEPVITPAPNGNVCFEWEDKARTLSTEIDDGGVHHYYYCHIDGTESEGESADSAMIRNLLIKL